MYFTFGIIFLRKYLLISFIIHTLVAEMLDSVF